LPRPQLRQLRLQLSYNKGRIILKVSDFTLALVLLAVALAMAVGALSFPQMPGQAFGAKLFPNIVAAGFVLCALALIMRAIKTKTLVISIVRPEWWNEPGRRGNLLILLGSIVAYTLLIERVGFVLTTFAMLVLLMRRLSATWKATLFASFLGTAVTYMMFAYWLRVPLPPGLLNGIVR
jgi:putative tricarboxylic transport membrane protein